MSARLASAAALAAGLALATLGGCHTARVLAPPPALRAASASHYAVDLEFAESLDRASAEDVSHYTLIPAGGGAPAVISSATLVDTLYGRVVQLLIPDWLTTDPDTSAWTISTSAVLDLNGLSTGSRTITFTTGLGYRTPVRQLLDAKCSSCHGAARADRNYRTDSYAALFGGGRDTIPNVVAGDPTCRLVAKCKPHASMFSLAGLTYLDYEIVLNWVSSFGARP